MGTCYQMRISNTSLYSIYTGTVPVFIIFFIFSGLTPVMEQGNLTICVDSHCSLPPHHDVQPLCVSRRKFRCYGTNLIFWPFLAQDYVFPPFVFHATRQNL